MHKIYYDIRYHMKYIIRYGTLENHINITQMLMENYCKENIIHIPKENRKNILLKYFTLLSSQEKTKNYIFIYNNTDLQHYDDNDDIYIDINKGSVYINNDVPYYIRKIYFSLDELAIWLQSKLKIDYGTFQDELPEQKMSIRYLTGNEKVLELGGNIGRNSLIIASILNMHNNNNFVSIECNTDIAKQLKHNKEKNNLDFYIEESAISKRRLIQNGWHNVESEILLENHLPVTSISWESFQKKYNIKFDTLVIDCEEAFYYILKDMPEILDNINTIMMENDYLEIHRKHYVDEVLKKYNFKVDYTETGFWPIEHNRLPCYHNFYEVWIKNT